jgi:hypothetical protein
VFQRRARGAHASAWHPLLVSDRSQARGHRRSATIACSLSQSDLAERQERWLGLVGRAAIEAVTTSDGLRLLFRAEPGVEAELRQLAELERDCCAFAEWSVGARGTELLLDVTAESEQGISAVQAMFGRLRSARAATSG